MEALQELFMTVLLPDRRLKVLEQQPLQVRACQCCVHVRARARARACARALEPPAWPAQMVRPPVVRAGTRTQTLLGAPAITKPPPPLRANQSLPAGKAGEKRLLLWGVEDAVRSRYGQYVGLLEATSTDTLDYLKARPRAALCFRPGARRCGVLNTVTWDTLQRPPNTNLKRTAPPQERALKSITALLTAKPEAEARLLSALVNKLGDPSRKGASNAGHHLGQVLAAHPAMKPIVVREVRAPPCAAFPRLPPPPPPPRGLGLGACLGRRGPFLGLKLQLLMPPR